MYNEEEQRDFAAEILRGFDESLAVALGELGADDAADLLQEVAADLLATFAWMRVPRFKKKAFEAEDEWRLVVCVPTDAALPLDPMPEPSEFRESGGRVVPYRDLELDPLPVTRLELGFRSVLARERSGLDVLLSHTVGALEVRISEVPVQ